METTVMHVRYVLLASCLFASPALADGPVQISQVVPSLNLGGGNSSTITQTGRYNVAETDQTGSLDMAGIHQLGNNNVSQIIQTNVGDVAIDNQLGSGLSLKIVQTGPAQQITVTQRR
jgi:hypothetical protein